MRLKKWGFEHYLLLISTASLGLGAGFQGATGAGAFLPGFLAASLLIFVCSFLMLLTWRWAGGGKVLAWMMILAFVLRLVLAAFLIWGLPQFGYDTGPQQIGFVFEDAFRREESAWQLAKSDQSLLRAFSDEYNRDQYGGMLMLSALVYRVLTPDAYRPGLIAILSAAALTLSIPLFVTTLRRQFTRRTATWAGWILALYPEGLLLGAAQMREPFFILLICILFWALAHWLDRAHLKLVLPVFALGTVTFLLFSYRVAIPSLGVLFLWVWVVESGRMTKVWLKVLGWALIALAGVGSLYFIRPWLAEVLRWDAHLTVMQSGMVQFLLERLPAGLTFPFILIYGLLQPVLPAAIAVPGPAIWKSISIFRALGWYTLLPLLVYATIRIWKAEPPVRKRWLGVFLMAALAWLLIASARAGGDQWDNPRYRTIFLPWMALLAGWGLDFAGRTKDRWLGRLLAVEGVFLLFFTEWYVSRYFPVIPRLEFELMVGLIVVLSLAILLGGWLWDRRKKLSK
ncbi:MAG: hypothetical protein SVR81_09525 [Chloroflexota bacterium]|nr:hypothetical protein [Chloroflexota bacterium]